MGGLGPGPFTFPFCLLFFRMDTKSSIATANFSIFISSFFRYFVYIKKPHPLKQGKGVLVDYNIAIIMHPMLILGVSFGVILNIIAPDVIIRTTYIVVLSTAGIFMFIGGLKMCKEKK